MNLFLARMRNRLIRVCHKGKRLHPLARRNLASLDHIDLSKKARSQRYVVTDLETTGLDLKRDRVVSIGALRVVEGRIQLREIFNRLINPGQYIPPASIKIHGIVPDMVSEADSAGEVLDDFMSFLGTDIFVGHYARFDVNFLNKGMSRRYGIKLQNIVLDTVLLCRTIAFPPHHYPYGIDLDNVPSSLDDVAKHFGVDIHERHTALGDALATAMILQHILARAEKTSAGLLRDLVKVGSIRL